MYNAGIPVYLWTGLKWMTSLSTCSSEAEGDISLSPIAQGNQVCM